MGKKWIWVDPICVIGEFYSMGPTPAALPCFPLLVPGLSQPGLFSAMSILPCFFPVPRLWGEISLHNRQHGKEQIFLCSESVPSASLWYLLRGRKIGLPLCGSSFPCVSCLSSQLALEEQKAVDKWMRWFPGTDTACPCQPSRLCWSLLKSVKR